MGKSLSVENRQFFNLLAEAATTNPFSDAYLILQMKIADCARPLATEKLLEKMVARVAEKVQKLEEENCADIRHFSGKDRELLRRAFLFDAYHQFLPQLDRHIRDQSKAGDRPIPVPFYKEIFEVLHRRGCSGKRRFFIWQYFTRSAVPFFSSTVV